MDVLIYLLSVPVAALAGYIASRRHTLKVVFVFIAMPVLVLGIDVFVAGNLTTLRQIYFAIWSFLSLWGVLNYKPKE